MLQFVRYFAVSSSVLIASLLLSALVSPVLARSSQPSPPGPQIISAQWLTASPEKCVVQSQGDPCRASVRLNWQLAAPGDVCLYLGRRSRPLQCWQDREHDTYEYELDSPRKVKFWLVRMPDRRRIADTSVSVVWVQERQPERRRWRLF